VIDRLVIAGLLLSLLAGGPALAQSGSGRHLAVVLDTSGSMDGNDRPRLAVQTIKILADMLRPTDRMSVVKMPRRGGCGRQPDASLVIDTDAAGVAGFKSKLEQLRNNTSTEYSVPLATAQQLLDASSAAQRLLIVIADASSDSCIHSQQILDALRADGVFTAGVSVGTGRALPQRYDTTATVQDASQLLTAVGGIFQQFLGAKAPGSGQLSPSAARISAEVAPFVAEAFVLVAAEGAVGSIAPVAGNPAAAGVDASYRTGETRGIDKRERGYRILRLERPNAGIWRFDVGGLTSSAGWFLIQDFSVSMRLTPPATVAQVDLPGPAHGGSDGKLGDTVAADGPGQHSVNVTATYAKRPDGGLTVQTVGRNAKARMRRSEVTGTVHPADPSGSKLILRFFKLIRGDLWVIGLDPEYRWVLTGTPSRKRLWLIARAPHIEAEAYDQAMAIAAAQGFDAARVKRTEQQAT